MIISYKRNVKEEINNLNELKELITEIYNHVIENKESTKIDFDEDEDNYISLDYDKSWDCDCYIDLDKGYNRKIVTIKELLNIISKDKFIKLKFKDAL